MEVSERRSCFPITAPASERGSAPTNATICTANFSVRSSNSAPVRPALFLLSEVSKVSSLSALVLRHHLAPLEVEAEADLLQAFFAHRVAEFSLVAGIEHQETAAAGANEFAAKRAMGHRVVIPVVDVCVAH